MTSLPNSYADTLAALENDPDLSSDNEADPLAEVASWERGGKIINEHYSLEEYVKRRDYFLSKHPDYKHHSKELFQIARRAAEDVFHSEDEQLSVQEVRRRELANEEFPLLPFPTTENCDTLGDFAGYPSEEWKPEPVSNTGSKAAICSKNNPANTTKTVVQAKQTADVDRFEPSKPTGEPTLASSSCTDMSNQQSSNTGPPSQSGLNGTTSAWRDLTGLAQSKNYTPQRMEAIQVRLGRADSGLDLTDRPLAPPTLPGRLIAAPGVSSLSGRPITDQPVKTRSTKRAAAELSNDEDALELKDTIEKTSEQKSPPAKRTKLLDLDATAEDAGERQPSPAKKKPSTSSTKSNGGVAASKKRKTAPSKKASIGDVKPDHFEAVISGDQLPDTVHEATNASEARHKRLLTKHKRTEDENATKKSRSERARKDKQNPDMMPEFFSPENFAKGRESESVRCVCGTVEDDKTDMIACDNCGVWQHNKCMGDAVPADLEKGKYLCHVCDPFTHRAMIAGLRRDNPIDE